MLHRLALRDKKWQNLYIISGLIHGLSAIYYIRGISLLGRNQSVQNVLDDLLKPLHKRVLNISQYDPEIIQEFIQYLQIWSCFHKWVFPGRFRPFGAHMLIEKLLLLLKELTFF